MNYPDIFFARHFSIRDTINDVQPYNSHSYVFRDIIQHPKLECCKQVGNLYYFYFFTEFGHLNSQPMILPSIHYEIILRICY